MTANTSSPANVALRTSSCPGRKSEKPKTVERADRAFAMSGESAVMRLARRVEDRRPLHRLDAFRAGRQHHETVEAERRAARVGHLGERREEILVDRGGCSIDALLFRHVGHEPAPLLDRIE